MLRLDTLFRISPSSGVPIYRQSIDQVRSLITSGRWPEGVMLSAVRQIAEKSETNRMTVFEAYGRPEAAGMHVRGRGCVAPPTVVTAQ